MPRAVVITRLDHPRADFDTAVTACRAAFGDNVMPLYLPLDLGDGPASGLLACSPNRSSTTAAGRSTRKSTTPTTNSANASRTPVTN